MNFFLYLFPCSSTENSGHDAASIGKYNTLHNQHFSKYTVQVDIPTHVSCVIINTTLIHKCTQVNTSMTPKQDPKFRKRVCVRVFAAK